MSKRTYEEYIKNDCHPVGYNEPCQSYYFGQTSVDLLLDKIDQLKQQLAEKDKEIAHLKEKDNYHLRYELAGADETITNLKKQIEEKNKEIESLKVFEKAYYFNQLQASQEDIQQFQQLANQSAVNINHIAITELEKVKEKIDCEMAIREYNISEQTADVCVSIADQIDNQIKELKG